MKKRLLSVLLCTAMVASMLIGCGGSKEEAPAEDLRQGKLGLQLRANICGLLPELQHEKDARRPGKDKARRIPVILQIY